MSLALNCIECTGRGLACPSQGREVECQAGESRCGREWLLQNDTFMFHEGCVKDGLCIGSIDCNKDGFKLGQLYKNGRNCVVTCCDGDICNKGINHTFPFYCFQCQAKGEECYLNSKACAYGEDRCLRVNFKVGSELMTEQRCYQSSRCSNSSEICDMVKKDHPTASECKHVCCETFNYCDHKIPTNRPSSSLSLITSCLSLIYFLLLFVTTMQNE